MSPPETFTPGHDGVVKIALSLLLQATVIPDKIHEINVFQTLNDRQLSTVISEEERENTEGESYGCLGFLSGNFWNMGTGR